MLYPLKIFIISLLVHLTMYPFRYKKKHFRLNQMTKSFQALRENKNIQHKRNNHFKIL